MVRRPLETVVVPPLPFSLPHVCSFIPWKPCAEIRSSTEESICLGLSDMGRALDEIWGMPTLFVICLALWLSGNRDVWIENVL